MIYVVTGNEEGIHRWADTPFRAAITIHNCFIIQREDWNDYGADIQIEARNGNAMANIRAHVQLKATASTAKTNVKKALAESGKNISSDEYWEKLGLA